MTLDSKLMEETDIDVEGQTDGGEAVKNTDFSGFHRRYADLEQSASSLAAEVREEGDFAVRLRDGPGRRTASGPDLYRDLGIGSRLSSHTCPSVPHVSSIIGLPVLSSLLSKNFPSCFEHFDPGRCAAGPSLPPSSAFISPVSHHGMIPNYPVSQFANFPTGIIKVSSTFI
ncbi:forkhead box protein D1-like [Scomber scombrus]|uniref:Forkhead box protein D1-like n=1 Tax=Scomber scombrus TaxID=13677 RepID=A0AAV1N2T9_SCOSC